MFSATVDDVSKSPRTNRAYYIGKGTRKLYKESHRAASVVKGPAKNGQIKCKH